MGRTDSNALRESELGYKLHWHSVTNSHSYLGMFTMLNTFLEAPSNFYVATKMFDVFFCKITLDLTNTLGRGI